MGTARAFHDSLRVVQAGLDILAREFRVGGEQLVHVRIFGQVSEDMLDRNAGAAHNGLADHNLGIGYDTVIVIKLLFIHLAYLVSGAEVRAAIAFSGLASRFGCDSK